VSGELAEEGWFGTGRPHPRLAERIGDVTLVMNACYTIKDWAPGEPRTCISATTAGSATTRC
jgi:hypothetical protein